MTVIFSETITDFWDWVQLYSTDYEKAVALLRSDPDNFFYMFLAEYGGDYSAYLTKPEHERLAEALRVVEEVIEKGLVVGEE